MSWQWKVMALLDIQGAPYDRILATCGLKTIPRSWFAQLKQEGWSLAMFCST